MSLTRSSSSSTCFSIEFSSDVNCSSMNPTFSTIIIAGFVSDSFGNFPSTKMIFLDWFADKTRSNLNSSSFIVSNGLEISSLTSAIPLLLVKQKILKSLVRFVYIEIQGDSRARLFWLDEKIPSHFQFTACQKSWYDLFELIWCHFFG